MAIREPLTRRLTQIQDDLLDPDNASDDWKQVLLDRRSLRRLDMLCSNQLDALDSLRRNFEEHGINVRFDLVPNMPHDGLKAVSRVEDFFADELAKRRAGAARAA